MTTFTTEDRIEATKIEQGSLEWKMLRAGKVTASRVADVLSKIKSGESAGRKNYKMDLVAERLTNQPAESFTNSAMQWGTEQEPFARIAYETKMNLFVEQIPFMDHPKIEWFGCSPDGLVAEDGLIEIKCPNTTTHLEYIDGGKPPAKYIPQMQTQMACTGRKWCDFVSFDPRLPENLQLFVVRLDRDDGYIKDMEVEVQKFLQEVNELFTKLKERMYAN
jgi:putative phage-type endonuclease